MMDVLWWFVHGFMFAFGALAAMLLVKITASEKDAKAVKLAEKANDALLARNDIGSQQVDMLERIAEAMESRLL